MRRLFTTLATATLAVLTVHCGAQDDRSPSAREALAAVAELRSAVDELESLAHRAKDLEDRMLAGGGGGESELEAIHARRRPVQERAMRLAGDLERDLERRLANDPK